MALAFPNASRSYDEKRKAVRFSGHDGMFEVRFFIEVDAIAGANARSPNALPAEARFLSAFDDDRKTIYQVAQKVYAKARNNVFTLTATDFR